uniref:CARD domain-containing protein n=1 Tax=Electrophorus electricus TaxID=8005 RepID=A0AAY5EHY2_ELEEL
MTFLLDKVLERVRTELKDSLTDSVIKQLLDDLNDEKVFGEEEVESILQQNPLQADRARCLIGSVKKKGPKACQILLEKLQKRDKYVVDFGRSSYGSIAEWKEPEGTTGMRHPGTSALHHSQSTNLRGEVTAS